jgi:hypothetical protein
VNEWTSCNGSSPVVTVLQADLRDDVERIAALINDSKAGAAYDAASAFGGALGSGGGFGS